MRGNFNKRTDEENRRMGESRMGENNPNWKGGTRVIPELKAAYLREWREKNPDYDRRRKYQAKYGITLEDYEAMMATQGGVCAICEASPGLRRLNVDHDHETGAIRGLLCEICNRALGGFKDDPDLLSAAARYLTDARS